MIKITASNINNKFKSGVCSLLCGNILGETSLSADMIGSTLHKLNTSLRNYNVYTVIRDTDFGVFNRIILRISGEAKCNRLLS